MNTTKHKVWGLYLRWYSCYEDRHCWHYFGYFDHYAEAAEAAKAQMGGEMRYDRPKVRRFTQYRAA